MMVHMNVPIPMKLKNVVFNDLFFNVVLVVYK